MPHPLPISISVTSDAILASSISTRFKYARLRIKCSLPELLGVHFTQTFVTLQGKAARYVFFGSVRKCFVIVQILFFSLLPGSLCKEAAWQYIHVLP